MPRLAVSGCAPHRIIALLCLLLAMSLPPAKAAERTAAETRLKASFVYKFTHFVEWPGDSLGPLGRTLRICTLGSRTFTEQLGKTVYRRSAHGHALEVFHLADDSSPRSCRVLFVDRASDRLFGVLSDRLRGHAILTIGESQSFLDQGGMIALLKRGRRLQFEVNRQALRESGLLPSSQLLRLASKPTSGDGGGRP